LTACFLLFLPSVSLLLARMTTIIISTLSLSLCSIKGYEKKTSMIIVALCRCTLFSLLPACNRFCTPS
jgi:predicted neutral ceramidase superfamily lipid hydrolase